MDRSELIITLFDASADMSSQPDLPCSFKALTEDQASSSAYDYGTQVKEMELAEFMDRVSPIA